MIIWEGQGVTVAWEITDGKTGAAVEPDALAVVVQWPDGTETDLVGAGDVFGTGDDHVWGVSFEAEQVGDYRVRGTVTAAGRQQAVDVQQFTVREDGFDG